MIITLLHRLRLRKALIGLVFVMLINGGSLSTMAAPLQAQSLPSDYFSLPWKVGISWAFTQGPHGNTPPSALDFGVGGVPDKDDNRLVRAVAPGTARLVANCPDWVMIKHDNGWSTGYAHMTDISKYFPKGKKEMRVERGQPIGKASDVNSKCGVAKGPHLHIWFLDPKDKNVDVTGLIIGGWKVESNRLVSVKNSKIVVALTQNVSNDGTIGSGPQSPTPQQPTPVPQPPARPVLTYIKLYKSGANVYGNFCIDADSYTLQWGSAGRWDSGAPRGNGAINGCRSGVWFFSGVTDASETLWVQIAAKAGDLERIYKVAIRNTGSTCQLERNDTPLKKTTECVFTNS